MAFRLENKTTFKLVLHVVLLKGSAQIPILLKTERHQLCRLTGHPQEEPWTLQQQQSGPWLALGVGLWLQDWAGATGDRNNFHNMAFI